MKITIPKIIREVPLADYAPEMNGAVVKVWVNPTRDFLQQISAAITQEDEQAAAHVISQPVSEWYAQLLSQAPDAESHWTADELQAVADTDPALWAWLISRCWSRINDHIAVLEKKPERP
jgi:hypothetical protein